MKKITKQKIVDDIYSKLDNINRIVVKNVVDSFVELFKEYLVSEDEIVIELRKLGVFEKKESKRKFVFNPKTGEKILLKKFYKIKFKPSKIIKDSLKSY